MHRFLLFKDIYTSYNTELPMGAALLSKIFHVKNLPHEWQETLPTKTGLNSISESMYVCKRGLVHKASSREDKESCLWVSSWLTLLSVHPPPGRKENVSRQRPGDMNFYCICNETMASFFSSHFTPWCLNHHLPSPTNSDYTAKATACFIACVCAHH